MASVSSASPFETSLYVGICLQNILYGVELVLYHKTMRIFLGRIRKRHESDVFFAAFSTVMFLLATGWAIIDAMTGEDIWLLDRNYPGGPVAYLSGPPSDWCNRVRTVVVIVLQQMTDGLMVHRCRIVWDSRRVIIVPSILWSVNLALGILAMATQETDPYTARIYLLFSFTYYILAVLLTTTLTCMICYRLLRHARQVKELLGEEFASPYFTIAMLLVESVLPYTLCGIVMLVAFWTGWLGMGASRVYTLMMCVSPQMLILRVAEGNAWQKDTLNGPTSVIKFSPSHGDTSGSSSSRFDDGGAAVKHPESLPSVYHPEPEKHSDKV